MNLESLAGELKKGNNFIILTHHNADVDAVASLLVLKEVLESLDKKVDVGVAESVSEVGRNFISKEDKIMIDPKLAKYENIVIVDTSSPEQLEPIEIPKEGKIFVIDHHSPGSLTEKSKSYVEPQAKSCAEIIYKITRILNKKISPRSAFLLAGGITYDTAHLRKANVGTFKILAKILELSNKGFEDVLSCLRTEIDISEKIANLKALKRVNSYRIADVLVSFTYVGSFEASVARNLLRLGADISIVGSPRKNFVRISGRMKRHLKNKIDLSKIFSDVGPIVGGSGGGHYSAASLNGKKPGKMKKAFKEIRKILEKKLKEKAKKL